MLLKIWVALAAIPLALCAKSYTTEDFSALAAKASDGVIKLDEQLFDALTSPKREWSVLVQLTALDKNMRCTPCREFDPSFRAVAKAWSTVPKETRDKHFFASADFAEAQEIFRKLNLMSAPVVTFYPPTQGPNKLSSGKTEPFNYDFGNFGNDAKEFALQMSGFTPVPIPYKAPMDWGLVFSVIATLLFCTVAARLVLPVIMSRWSWAIIVISTMLIMTSGFMFVRIRGMPYRTKDHSMLPGYQNQVGAEIWTVSFKYFTLSSSFLALILGAPRQTNKSLQRASIYLFTLVIAVTFSALIKDFKVKNPGYPFAYIF